MQNPADAAIPLLPPLQRFQRSLQAGLEQWRDGIGYDLLALHAASPEERSQIASLLLSRPIKDWRDIEALATLTTLGNPEAQAALEMAARQGTPAIRLAIQRYAPTLIEEEQYSEAMVAALDNDLLKAWSPALDRAEECHPSPVIAALLRGVLHGQPTKAVNFAAMLMYVHDQADAPFDLEQRPFFLTFDTLDKAERTAAFRVLCEKIGLDAEEYL